MDKHWSDMERVDFHFFFYCANCAALRAELMAPGKYILNRINRFGKTGISVASGENCRFIYIYTHIRARSDKYATIKCYSV